MQVENPLAGPPLACIVCVELPFIVCVVIADSVIVAVPVPVLQIVYVRPGNVKFL
jgi:hypothetical protein